MNRVALSSLFVLSVLLGSAALAQQAGLSIRSITLAKGWEDGAAVDAGTSFRSSDRIFVIVRVSNPDAAETEVRVSVEQVDGSARQGITLQIPARRGYRTLARFTGRPAGSYRAVVRNAAGEEIGSAEFTVTE